MTLYVDFGQTWWKSHLCDFSTNQIQELSSPYNAIFCLSLAPYLHIHVFTCIVTRVCINTFICNLYRYLMPLSNLYHFYLRCTYLVSTLQICKLCVSLHLLIPNICYSAILSQMPPKVICGSPKMDKIGIFGRSKLLFWGSKMTKFAKQLFCSKCPQKCPLTKTCIICGLKLTK